MRRLLLGTPLIAMGLAGAVSVAAEPAGLWMPATATGCLVWSPLSCSGGTAAWSGACRNRRASGQGTLTLQCGSAEEQYSDYDRQPMSGEMVCPPCVTRVLHLALLLLPGGVRLASL